MSNAYQIGDKVRVTYLCPSQRTWLRQLAAFNAEVLDIYESGYEVQYEHNQAFTKICAFFDLTINGLLR